MNEFYVAQAAVICFCYLGLGRVRLGAMMWASFCVFIGYVAGMLAVVHMLPP